MYKFDGYTFFVPAIFNLVHPCFQVLEWTLQKCFGVGSFVTLLSWNCFLINTLTQLVVVDSSEKIPGIQTNSGWYMNWNLNRGALVMVISEKFYFLVHFVMCFVPPPLRFKLSCKFDFRDLSFLRIQKTCK